MANIHEMQPTGTPTGTSVPIQHGTEQHDAGWDHLRGDGAQRQDMGAQVKETLQDMGTQVKETMTEYYEQGRESLQDLNQTLEAQIRERPLQTLLVAGGIGLLLGLLWRRS
jgi:ElaB/YqjD/DUF883 family membrane-anchored ribosome-binding protein